MLKVVKGPDCWLWTGNKTKKGYGHFRATEKLTYAHRFAYETYVGPIPKNMTIDHICNNPSCVRPDHLRVVSNRNNNLRAKLRRRLL